MNKLNNRLKWGIVGGFLGGLIAIIGFWILSPSTSSVLVFITIRVIVGAFVAMLAGPIITSRLNKNKTE